MQKLIKPGRIIFAIGITALGILCMIAKDFIVGRPRPWPADFTVNPALGYISGAIIIIAAIAILLEKKGGLAALLIASLIFVLSVSRSLPHFITDWLTAYKSMALSGGALIVASSFSGFSKSWIKIFVVTGCVSLAAFFIAGGYAHFKFAGFVTDLIPSYIPFRSFWAYFCGICLLAGGIGLLIPPLSKWAALLSGIMIAGWFILLHIPRFITNTNDASERMGLFESFTFAGIFFVLAGMISEGKVFKV